MEEEGSEGEKLGGKVVTTEASADPRTRMTVQSSCTETKGAEPLYLNHSMWAVLRTRTALFNQGIFREGGQLWTGTAHTLSSWGTSPVSKAITWEPDPKAWHSLPYVVDKALQDLALPASVTSSYPLTTHCLWVTRASGTLNLLTSCPDSSPWTFAWLALGFRSEIIATKTPSLTTLFKVALPLHLLIAIMWYCSFLPYNYHKMALFICLFNCCLNCSWGQGLCHSTLFPSA